MKKVCKIIYFLSVLIMLIGCENVTKNNKKSDSAKMDEKQMSEMPEEDIDTQNQVNQKIISEKPLENNNSRVKMKTKISKEYQLEIKLHNNSKEKISFSSVYQLYMKSGEDWKKIDCLPNVGFKDIEYYLQKNEMYSDKVNLKNVFGKLDTGQYKIEKEVNFPESRILVSSEFEV